MAWAWLDALMEAARNGYPTNGDLCASLHGFLNACGIQRRVAGLLWNCLHSEE
jgi:hypothetical protein